MSKKQSRNNVVSPSLNKLSLAVSLALGLGVATTSGWAQTAFSGSSSTGYTTMTTTVTDTTGTVQQVNNMLVSVNDPKTPAYQGFSLYTFDPDLANPGRSVCNGGCAVAWPPLIVDPTLAVTGPFSIITRDDGKSQLAYNGMPLYYWFQDRKPGDVNGDRHANWHTSAIRNADQTQFANIIKNNEAIVTTGLQQHGIFLTGANAAANGHTVSLTNSSITTTGAGADGIQVSQSKNANTPNSITLDNTVVKAQGSHSRALAVQDNSSANVLVKNHSVLQGDIEALRNSTLNLVVDNSTIIGNLRDNDYSVPVKQRAPNGTVLSFILQNGSTFTGSIDPAPITLNNSTWNVTGNSDVTTLAMNNGTINYVVPAGKSITANSLSGAGGNITMNTVASQNVADSLHITGNASGVYAVTVNNTGPAVHGKNNIRLVQVDGNNGASFRLANASPVESGSYDYLLHQSGKDVYLGSTYRSAIPGYMLAPGMNLNYGYAAIGSLQERAGDMANQDRAETKLGGGQSVWARLNGSQLSQDTSNDLHSSASTTFMQFGSDWTLATATKGAGTHAGATLTLGETNAGISDNLRAMWGQNGSTGSVNSKAVGVGAYWSTYRADGGYLDLNGQVTFYRNEYKDARARQAANKGTGVALSAEVGKPLELIAGNSLRIEPQAQLIYQYLKLDNFQDYAANISSQAQNAVRGRVGMRLFREMENGKTPRSAAPYLSVDVLHDFTGAATVTAGSDALSADTNKTWGEIGIGMTGELAPNSRLYASVKYQHQFGGESREGAAGQVGYRYHW
ncbi:autotransporter outer membrane beta-barrel domain-containing protein [Herbaspirillum sp. LeCh32-8]|uniref:autotransporter outer membrane beta-barrel domain-containing protein n=1 Tax=Herbaspirillum sp. LeCh32-8 TaxID=2821356 RepID=UPI001AE64662|nr:autotransporter outer membrane beta-barrel domain-containing protein [Herbaspirillum sp. LeCh32-8]MBP0596638.1 autotransporter outer membrane beta-barrel domain-containing protein [Herbaspirillum sp. LeCh32-8]